MSSAQFDVGQNADEAVKKVVQRCIPVAFNTSPCDRRRTEDAIGNIYQNAGLKPPRYFVWFDSPFHGAIAAAMVTKGTKSVHKQVVTDFRNRCNAGLWHLIEERGDKQWWTTVQSKLTPALKRSFATVPQQVRRAVLASFVGHVGPGVDNINLELVWGQLAPPALLSKLVGQLCQILPVEITKPFEEYDDRPLTSGLAHSAMGQFSFAGFGNLDADLPFYDISGAAGFRVPEIMPFFHLARFGHYWWPFDDVCLLVDRPERLSVDHEGLLHNAIGCALRYRDGWETFAWHGTFVPDRFLEFGIKKDVTLIFYEPNVEIRRMMLEMYGLEAFIKDSGAAAVQRDKCGVLYRQHFGDNHEDIVIVHVINSTPEPDGSYNNYFLRVPPETQSAREGVAWTFGLTADEYDPIKET